jgi:sulfate-transporting ATPase
MASHQHVHVMKYLTKAFPGVQIGVLGVNGASKSPLLKIMAGSETEFGGEAWAAEGVRVGYLVQQPALDAGATTGATTVADGA